jgi:hypothetical protein
MTNTTLTNRTSNVTLSGGNLTATTTDANGGVAFSSDFKNSGLYYFEATLTAMGANGNLAIGVANSSYSAYTSNAAHTISCFPEFNNGAISLDTSNQAYSIGAAVNGDTLCVAINFTAGRIYFRKNATGLWSNSGDPVAGTGGTLLGSNFTSVAPVVNLGNSSGEIITFNFGNSAFVGAVPTGYTAGWPVNSGNALAFESPNQSIFSSTSSGSINVTTLGPNRIIVLTVMSELNGTVPTVSSVTASGLTFALRNRYTDNAAGAGNNIEVWWAYSSAQVTALPISVTLSSATDDSCLGVFAVRGVTNYAAPWDTNISVPATQKGQGTTVSIPVSSTASSGLLLGFWGNNYSTTGTSGSGFTQVLTSHNGGGSRWANLVIEVEAFSTVQSGTPVTFSVTSGSWVAIADIMVSGSTTSVNASAAQTLDNLSQLASSAVIDNASATQTLGNLSQLASSTVVNNTSAIQTLGGFTQSGAIQVINNASGTQYLDNSVQSSQTTVYVSVSGIQTLASLIQVATITSGSAAAVNASAIQTLDVFTQIGSITVSIDAAEITAFGNITQTATITVVDDAIGIQTLGNITQTAIITVIDDASATQTLEGLNQSGALAVIVQLQENTVLDSLTQNATTLIIVNASGIQTLDGLTQAADALVMVNADGIQILDGLSQVGMLNTLSLMRIISILGQITRQYAVNGTVTRTITVSGQLPAEESIHQ